MKIVPTLLTLDKFELCDQLELFQKYFNRIQIDVADGILVPNVTTQIDEFIDLNEKNHVELKPNICFDFHLMVKNYKAELEKIKYLQSINVKINTVLINSNHGFKYDKLRDIYNFAIGLDIFPQAQIADIALHYDLKAIKHIQIMTVEPGFQGSPFLPDMLNKITQLHVHYYSGEILIDGGVNSKTLPLINSNKNTPDVVCIGSFLTKAGDDLRDRIDELKIF